MYRAECLILGAGIIGLTLARELIRQGTSQIIILEKEPEIGLHASGRNSGVLHAGVYYPPNTLKAQLCLKGNLMLQAYCQEKNLPLKKTGKVIVAKNETELPILRSLHDRALQNGADVTLLNETELAVLEPHAKTHQQALYSRLTAVTDQKAILKALEQELRRSKRVTFLLGTRLHRIAPDQRQAETSKGAIAFERCINATGAYADQVARLFGLGHEYQLIPFKGIYQKLKPEHADLVQGNIYPVPHLDNPFLGVHFTKNIHGEAYVGPTAIPALGRENYGILKGIDGEAFKILFQEMQLFFSNRGFRKVALEEPKKYLPFYFYQDAKQLVKQLKPDWLTRSPKVGIRPQLIHKKKRELMMDFLILKNERSIHVLNAISPAFTSSMAFAEYLIKTHW